MHKMPPKKLALDSTLPPGGLPAGIRRRPQQTFPDVGRTLSTYKYDAFSQAPPPHRKKKAKAGFFRRWSKKKVIFFLLLPFIVLGVWVGIKFGYNASKIFGGNVFSVLTTTKLKGEDTGRVNILVAGNSADDIGHNGGNLTDSIMIMSVDTRHNTALLLSIPRDLYVDVPGFGHSKINEAYVEGENSGFDEPGYPHGGMGLLEKTIYETLGIKSNYYALVNYSALRDTVNSVGGIDVVINSSNKRGLYDPSKDYTTGGKLVKLSNGPHHLDGQQALNLSRARGDAPGSYGFENSDFTRTANQRMMLLALKKKIFTSGVLANPVKLGSLSDALGNNVKSDMKLSEVRRLYDLSKNISNNNITSSGLNDLNKTNYLGSYRTKSGQSALIPAAGLDDYSDIRAALRRVLSNNQIVREGAKVVVLNATDVSGLAADSQDKLMAKSVNVTDIADAHDSLSVSRIIDNSKGTMPNTLTLLQSMFGTDVVTTNTYVRRYPDADFIVVVGKDKIPAAPSSTSSQ
jgi:LCP family protein required for cell wall assembly